MAMPDAFLILPGLILPGLIPSGLAGADLVARPRQATRLISLGIE
jgi:hypothetical protein